MGSSPMGKFAVATGAVVVMGLATASPAMANTTVPVNPGNVPTTAAGHGDHDCDENFGGGPHAGTDVWVFVLPGNSERTGDFVSVTATFGAGGTLTIPADGGAIVTDKGTSKAWITTPAGWTLTGASAVITGTATKFNLTHTCPAGGGGQTSSPSPSPSGSTSPETPEAPESPAPTGGANGGSAGGGSGTAGASNGAGSGSLPVTGTAVTGLALTGAALVAGGIALLVLRRRRLVFSAGDDRA
jgi:LPXTG-motif cell wall-anchored protein